MKKINFLTLLICLFVSISIADAQILAWEMDGNTGDEVSENSTTTDTNLNISTLSRGLGIIPSGLANSFSSNNFTVGATTLSDAIANNDYLQFAITPNNGFRVSLNTLNANFRRSGTGPANFQWQYSLNGFSTAGINVGTEINFTSDNTNGVSQAPIDLSTISALQNVTFPNSVTIRLYGWNASAAGGTFAIGRLAGNDLAIGGITEAITTAASGTVAGRVRDGKGNGLKFVTVMITGGGLDEPLYATTNQFGKYLFEDIPVGENYVLQVFSRRHTFEQQNRIISLKDFIEDADFIGRESR